MLGRKSKCGGGGVGSSGAQGQVLFLKIFPEKVTSEQTLEGEMERAMQISRGRQCRQKEEPMESLHVRSCLEHLSQE